MSVWVKTDAATSFLEHLQGEASPLNTLMFKSNLEAKTSMIQGLKLSSWWFTVSMSETQGTYSVKTGGLEAHT